MLLLLLVFIVFSDVWVPVQSLRTLASIGSPQQHKRTGTATTSTADRFGAVLVSTIPRGGSDGDSKPEKKDANKSKNGEEDETEDPAEIEEIVEEIAQELVEDEEVEVEIDIEEEIVEEMEVEAESAAEEMEEEVDEIEEEEEVVAVEEKEEAVGVEEEEEEDVAVVYPTDEIPSDDIRAFHTTDGELADDEGIYTDGQNESPIAVDENESEDEEEEVEAVADIESKDADTAPNQAPITKTDVSTATATNNNADKTGAAAVTTIDGEMKRILISELRYTEADVSQMRPEIAAEVVRNSLAKPTEGMPPSFYLDPASRPTPSASNKFWSTKKIVLSVAGVAALSVGATALKDQENDLGESIEECIDALKEIPEKIAALVATVMNTRSKIETKAANTQDNTETVKFEVAAAAAIEEATKEKVGEDGEEEEEIASPIEQDTNVHSIRPGTKPEEIPDPDIDKTWLDKMLTGIERAIKSFLSIKI